MSHLLLTLSIITLLLVVGNGRENVPVVKSKVVVELEKPVVNNVESDFPSDKPSFFISRFNMFVY